MKKRVLCLAALAIGLVLILAACGQSWTCDECGKSWTGTAYYDYSGDGTLCEDCARTYWMPLPYQNYKK